MIADGQQLCNEKKLSRIVSPWACLWCCWSAAGSTPFRALPYPGLVKEVVYPLLYVGLMVFGVVWTVRQNRRPES